MPEKKVKIKTLSWPKQKEFLTLLLILTNPKNKELGVSLLLELSYILVFLKILCHLHFGRILFISKNFVNVYYCEPGQLLIILDCYSW